MMSLIIQAQKNKDFFFFLMAEEITRSIIKNILMFKYELF